MFFRTIWLFVLLCGSVNSAKRSRTLNRDSSAEIQVKYKMLQKEMMRKIIPVLKNDETRIEKVRTKRGIVMVDSDFDIPSEIYTYENNLDNGNILGENEGSGADGFDEKESTKTTKEDMKQETQYRRTTSKMTTTSTQSSTTATEEYAENKSIALTDPEGSGDIILLTEVYSTTETTKTIHIKPDHDVQERIPNICLDSICTTDDASISVSDKNRFIPEGTNITLTCVSNISNHNMLYWYKSNGSVYFLQAFSTEEELRLNVADTKPIHSGIYMCVKWVNKQNCCNVQSDITIYEVPLYQYHLLILGLIAIAALIICIFLSVRQSMVLKVYTKQFAEKHGSVKNQLL